MASVPQEELLYIDRNGRKLPVFVARTEAGGKHPAVIVIHEIFGLNDHIKDIARRFAQQGICAYAPDLFAEAPGLPADRNDLNAMRTVWSQIPDHQLINDLQAVFQKAAQDSTVMADKIGTIGYCMGGAIALMFACSTADVCWVADYYGRIYYPQLSATKAEHPIDYVKQLPCPLLGLFAGEDELITADQIADLEKAVKASGQRCLIKTYSDARHAFFNDTREFYNANAAEDAWRLTLQFISDSTKMPVAG